MGRGLSEMQIKALRATATDYWATFMTGPPAYPERSIGHAMFGKCGHLTAAERASMSRTIRRLVDRGLVVNHRGLVQLTDQGEQWLRERGYPLPSTTREDQEAARIAKLRELEAAGGIG